MHDAQGRPLEVGDKVTLTGRVTGLGAPGDFCNVDVALTLPMPAYPDQKTVFSAINTKQVVKDVGLGPVVQYVHKHGNGDETVAFVREELKGRNREHCLCYQCGNLMKKDGTFKRRGACHIAKILYRFVVKHSLVTPVFECPKFKQAEFIQIKPKAEPTTFE